MLPKYFPESWAEMRETIFDWAETESQLDTQWGRQTAPSLIKPFTSLTLVGAPVPQGRAAAFGTGIAMKFENFTANTLYRISVDGVNVDYTTGASGTVVEIRDSMLVLLQDISAPVQPYSFMEQYIILDPSLGANPVVTSAGPIAHKIVKHYLGEVLITFAVDVFAPGRQYSGSPDTPKVDAIEAYTRLVTSLEVPHVVESFRVGGLAFVNVGGEREFSAFVGGQWESRAGFDLTLRARTRYVVESDFIEFFDTTEVVGTVSP